MSLTPITLLTACLLGPALSAQDEGSRGSKGLRPIPRRSAEADGARRRSEDSSSQTSSQKSSERRVVVVRNGRTVTDEHWVDGKKVPTRVDRKVELPGEAGKLRRGAPALPGVTPLDAEALLRDLRRRMEADTPEDLDELLRRHLPDAGPARGRAGSPRAKDRDASSSSNSSSDSHSHRRVVVVRNGVTEVDDEWVDGKKVRSAGGGAGRPGSADRSEAKAEARAEASSDAKDRASDSSIDPGPTVQELREALRRSGAPRKVVEELEKELHEALERPRATSPKTTAPKKAAPRNGVQKKAAPKMIAPATSEAPRTGSRSRSSTREHRGSGLPPRER